MLIVPLTRITWVVMISLLGNLLVINQDKRPFLKSLHASHSLHERDPAWRLFKKDSIRLFDRVTRRLPVGTILKHGGV